MRFKERLKKVNWFAFVGSILIFLVIILSFFIPWWQLTIGPNLLKVNSSPVYTNFGVLGIHFSIPLIWAFSIISILMLLSSGILMLFYSIFPFKSYSKELLCFAYRKPLYVVIVFVGGLLIAALILAAIGVNIPIVGSATVSLPTSLIMGFSFSIRALASGSFLLPFWLAIIAAGLSICARVYHIVMVKRLKTTDSYVV